MGIIKKSEIFFLFHRNKYAMRLETSGFSNLRPRNVSLTPWQSPEHPQPNHNPMRCIIQFARYMGLREIPVRTLEKLCTDPYFKYCFYYLRANDNAYASGSLAKRRRLAQLIKKPQLANDADLARGLKHYLNSFIGYMPGGGYRAMLNDLLSGEYAKKTEQIIAIVDQEIKEQGLTLIPIPPPLAGPAQRVQYLKLCLKIFNALVEKHKFEPEELWM